MASVGSRGDEGAASSVVAFMIAGVLFMASVVAVLVTTRTSSGEGAGDPTENARFDIQSASLAEILFTSPGYFHEAAAPTAVSPQDWANAADYKGWTPDADRLDRLGLLDPDAPEPFMMDYAKFQNLRRAGFYTDVDDGFVNYEEAADGLGLTDAGLDFHIRAYPTLDSVRDLLADANRDSKLRVTYVGDIDVQTTALASGESATEGLTMTDPVCSLDPANPKAYIISTTVHNGGTAMTQFTAVTDVDIGGNNQRQDQNTNGYLVLPGQDVVLSVEVAALPGRDCIGGSAAFDLYDPVHGKLTPDPDGPGDGYTPSLTQPAGTVDPADIGLRIDTDKQNYRPDEDVLLNYDGVGLRNNDQLFLRVCPGTLECTSAGAVYTSPGGLAFSAGNNAASRIINIGDLEIPLSAVSGFTDGIGYAQYTAWLYDCEYDSCGSPAAPDLDNLRVTERILVTADEIDGYAYYAPLADPVYTPLQGPPQEVYNLDLLMDMFCPSFFDSKAGSPLSGWAGPTTSWDARCAFKGEPDYPATPVQPGDVFPDSKKVMNEDLPLRLICQEAAGCPNAALGREAPAAQGEPRYDLTDVLVVGSGVDHNAMTSQSAKGAIEDWVHGGGTILVFGSTEGNVRWLEPLFHSAIVGDGESISTPDQGHPMLHTPNELNNPGENYDNQNSAWRFNGQTALAQGSTEPVFSNIVVVGDALGGDPLLALSNKGSFGGGTIIITAYMPFDIYGTDPAGAELRDPTCSRAYDAAVDAFSRTLEECEGMFFMHNMLMQGYGDLFLEYGPEIPENTNVQPAIRLAQIRHPQFNDPIELTMIVYVF